MSEQAKKARSSTRKNAANDYATPLIIGVGASASAVQSLERYVANLAPAADHATIVVLQHREALDEQRLREAVTKRNAPALTAIENGAEIEGGKIYIAEPDLIVTVKNGRFRTQKAQQESGQRGSIDSFLVSLAEDQGERAVAVILCGTAGSGTLGVAAFKEGGGLTIAERGPDQSATDVALSNSPGALADFLLTPEEIPQQIALYARHLARLREEKKADELLAEISSALTAISSVLRNKTGHDFHCYKQNTFLRRVQRRIQVTQAESIGDYIDLLRTDANEVQNLFNDLLIGVTQFFRDAREFEALEKHVIPKLFEGKTSGDQLRIWTLGCATGEEAYSIAILLREHMERFGTEPHVQIFATDIDGRALATARVGRYMASIVDDVSPARLARWFVKEGNTYTIAKELREMCIFSAHNVIRDAPFSRLDLISCRNLLIYLNTELQDRVIPLFHFALRPDGYLFLGNAENVTRHPKLFEPVERRSRIFRRRETGTRVLPDFPITFAPRRVAGSLEPAPPRSGSDLGLTRRAERIAERYAPAYVITDENFKVLHFSGRTGRYLEPSPGLASLDLFALLHRDLRLDMRAAVMKAAETGDPVRVGNLKLGTNDDQIVVDIVVEPLPDPNGGAKNFVIVFKDGPLHATLAEHPSGISQLRDEHVGRLESELGITRERLQSTIEELESTNEELKSSNEEYQSLNEELQSANEELETSKEELQSVNEELTTVNGELAHRVQELTRATSDLKNFLESTQIATVFLDNELKVMNFTPALTEIFHLVETDIGRPIAHIKARIPLEELQEDVRRVLRTLSSIERTLDDPVTKARYIVRVLPYRSVDNFIAGVVVTFVDVTALTRAQERHKLLLAELQHRVRNTLAVVRAIARRTGESSTSVDDYAMHLEGRLAAFGRVQAAVTRDPGVGVNLATLVAEELLAHAAHEGEQATISGPPIHLRPKAAETFALAVHELATNAVKYGALSKFDGRVRIGWKINEANGASSLTFHWAESGGPKGNGAPRRRGFGTELLEQTLSYELKAQTLLDFAKDGLTCTIELPLTERVAVEPPQ